MRRPHPRFDTRRNAWVTNAGGKLKTLAKGPKTAESEQQAWEEFYLHMAQLGQPLGPTATLGITLGELAEQYGSWMEQEVAAERMASATLNYYRFFIQRFLDAVGGRRIAGKILPIELERYKTNWHSVQSIQRLYNWGVKMGVLDENPLRGIRKPEAGGRQRILSRTEVVQLMWASDRAFRDFLLALINSIARPQEIRAVTWKHFHIEPVPMFVLTEFKARRLRNNSQDVRRIPINDRLLRLLLRLYRNRVPSPDDHIFLNSRGIAWSSNAVRWRMRRLRDRLNLGPDENGENIVAYSLRHTGATYAAINGVRDKILAELMGHTRTSTTERYQHFDADHLHRAISKVNHRMSQ